MYAVNGNTSLSSPVHINPGDKVTYELTYKLPVSNEENLRFTDYLPLPIFDVTNPAADGSVTSWSFSTTKNNMTPGTVSLGPADTFYQYMVDGTSGSTGNPSPTTNPNDPSDPLYHDGSITPNPVINATTNGVSVTYPDYDDTRLLPREVDLLVTATVTDQPFADQLYLTNEAFSFEGSTNAGTSSSTQIQQVVINEPVLVTSKSAVWTDQPGAVYSSPVAPPITFHGPSSTPRWTGGNIAADYLKLHPLNSDITGVDAGDTVTYAIVIQNTGSNLDGAFNIELKDTIPAGLDVPSSAPGMNLQIYYGDGSGPIAWKTLAGTCTGGPNDPCGPDHTYNTPDDLFGAGVELVDPTNGLGVCQTHNPNNNNDVILITYDLQVRSDIIAGQQLINTGSILHYSSQEGGPNYASGLNASVTTTISSPSIAKILTGTEINDSTNSSTQAVIGELVNYKVTITVPEGQVKSAKIVDTMDPGLAFVGLTGTVNISEFDARQLDD